MKMLGASLFLKPDDTKDARLYEDLQTTRGNGNKGAVSVYRQECCMCRVRSYSMEVRPMTRA